MTDRRKPERCECDQVQELRVQLAEAGRCENLTGALDRATGHALQAEGIIARCLAKMPEGMEHGGCLETAVDLLLSERAGQDTAEHDAKPDNPLDDPLDDPRMDGETWINAQDVTQEMLSAWPVWEWKSEPVVTPTHWSVWLAAGLAGVCYGEVRPLRAPGMNELGEIQAADMTEEFFERVAEWQCFERGEWLPYQDGMGGLRDGWPLRGCRFLVHAMRLRPAILAKLDRST